MIQPNHSFQQAVIHQSLVIIADSTLSKNLQKDDLLLLRNYKMSEREKLLESGPCGDIAAAINQEPECEEPTSAPSIKLHLLT